MPIPYLVRQKKNLLNKTKSGLWYAVIRKFQKRGGVNEKEIGELVAMRGGFSRGVVEGVLTAVGEAIEYQLCHGQSVTIRGFGTFQTALTSKGFERPEQVTPGEVSVSKVYFMADRDMLKRIKSEKCTRMPLSWYLPKELLSPEVLAEEAKEETEE